MLVIERLHLVVDVESKVDVISQHILTFGNIHSL